MTYNELKQIIERNGFCIEDFDEEFSTHQDLYIYVPDEGSYWSSSKYIHPLSSKAFVTATFNYGKLNKISIYKDLVIDATNKIYFEDKNEYVVVSSKITVDFLNDLCNTVKTNLQETKMKLKLNKIEEDFE
jgi:hypothetical protein